MRPVSLAAVFLAGCSGGGTAQRLPADPIVHGELADEDRFEPSYGKAELQSTLIAERAIEATAEIAVADLEATAGDTAAHDRLRVAAADLAVRRRFIAALEACEARASRCPPRLDDPAWNYDYDGDRVDTPPLDAVLRFDLEGWRAIASELYGRGCACRTMLCVDGVGVAIDRLERRAPPDVRGDDGATVSITRARECLFRLRSKSAHATAP